MDEEVTLLPERALRVDFDLGGRRLVPGVRGEAGLPVERFLEAFVVGEGDRVLARVGRPNDLSPFIPAIADDTDAMAFVRLFTSPETQHLFRRDEAVVEVVIVPDDADTGIGTLPASEASRLEVEAARVEVDRRGYRITRFLVQAGSPGSRRTISKRVERVSREGGYALVEDGVVAELPPDAVWMPYYE